MSRKTHYQKMLKARIKNKMLFGYALDDVWLTAADNMRLIKAKLSKGFVVSLKSNRNILLLGRTR